MKVNFTTKSYTQFNGDATLIITHKSNIDAKLAHYLALQQKTSANVLYIALPKELKSKHLIIATLEHKKPSFGKYQKSLLDAISVIKQRRISSLFIKTPTTTLDQSEAQLLQNTIRIIINSFYEIKKPLLKPNKPHPLKSIEIMTELSDKNLIKQGIAIADGMALTRHLGDLPSNICTPSFLADTASDMADEFGLDCQILDSGQMQKLGMNSLLSVAKGSKQPPKLISLGYHYNDDKKPIVLIGKGVTFDSGGISLKPSEAMDEMKYDMCGAASVLGVMRIVASLKLKLNLIVIVPTVENMPSDVASKPGDIVQSLDGQTIEILNTDAEGRLILCDAITYAKQQFNPQLIVDVATLTGAVIIALGKHYSGLMGNDNTALDDLKIAGEQSGDGVWQLPLADEYDELLKSNFADMANIGNREAGSITAACFLSRFSKKTPWAHLDIAGTAWNSGANKGATGRPVALLAQYLLNQI